MNLDQYKLLFDSLVFAKLEEMGFVKERYNLFLTQNYSTLALLRIETKWTRTTQCKEYLLCIRHNFLPDLEEQPISGFSHLAVDYPFRLNPNKLPKTFQGIFKKTLNYQYYSSNLGHYDTFEINYGNQDPLPKLKILRDNLFVYGEKWLDFLHPSEGKRQIKAYGNNEYIEKIWLSAYEKMGY